MILKKSSSGEYTIFKKRKSKFASWFSPKYNNRGVYVNIGYVQIPEELKDKKLRFKVEVIK